MISNIISLKKKSAQGSFWLLGLEVTNQALQFVKTIIAAKILLPKDFGIIGFSLLILSVLDTLTTTGMREAIIQKGYSEKKYLNTVWTIDIIKSIVIALSLYLLGNYFLDIVKPGIDQLTKDIVKLFGLIYVFQSSINVGTIFFEKELDFKKYFIFQISGTIIDVIITLISIKIFNNVWALFSGILFGTITRFFVSYLMIEYKPKFQYHKETAKELFGYGKWILGSRIFGFINLQGDSIFVSLFMGIKNLGLYQMASRIGTLPMNQFSSIIGRIAFPAMAKLNNDKNSIKMMILKIYSIITIFVLPVLLLAIYFMNEIILYLLNNNWIEIVDITRVLLIMGFFRLVISVIDSYFLATGKPKYSNLIHLFRFIVFILIIYPLYLKFGVLGVAVSAVFSILIVTIIFGLLLIKDTQIKRNELMEIIIPTSIIIIILTLSVLFFRHYYVISSLIELILFLSLFCIEMLVIAWLISKYSKFNCFSSIYLLLKALK